jgi:hypothetical protein
MHSRVVMMLDEFLPIYDVSDSVATVVEADVQRTWDALMAVDLIDVGRRRPLTGALGALRAMPEVLSHLLHGEPPAAMPASLTLRDTARMPMGEGGWVLLGERPNDEIALGLVGKFWRPVISYAEISSPGQFRDFETPGYAKTIYSLSVRAVGIDRTLVAGVMRTATTSDDARRRFRRYWTFGVGAGAHVLVQSVVDVVKDMAEQAGA